MGSVATYTVLVPSPWNWIEELYFLGTVDPFISWPFSTAPLWNSHFSSHSQICPHTTWIYSHRNRCGIEAHRAQPVQRFFTFISIQANSTSLLLLTSSSLSSSLPFPSSFFTISTVRTATATTQIKRTLTGKTYTIVIRRARGKNAYSKIGNPSTGHCLYVLYCNLSTPVQYFFDFPNLEADRILSLTWSGLFSRSRRTS